MPLHSSSSEWICDAFPCYQFSVSIRVILDFIEPNATAEQRAMAYVYAFLAFLCTVLTVHCCLCFMSCSYNKFKYRPKQMFSIFGLAATGGGPDRCTNCKGVD
ncbi:hypothetical protein JVT61DRAFT_13405 [Boletus reticuloceps]|uniref:Uncharacterized protein n=1 Tax=Boletus reticuloceps TaxID=495285 RepID=A0A8I2YD90_9AGAM|nr:hypothetical protein JVT61DRAFT_13405 [Boletus reticuloceps]